MRRWRCRCSIPTGTRPMRNGFARSWPRACPQLEIILSSDICPEPGEYERAMTTIVCAYITPLVSRYIDRLQPG